MTKMVLVPADVLTATVSYLVQRPYAEVVHLIPALRAAKEAPPEPPVPDRIEEGG